MSNQSIKSPFTLAAIDVACNGICPSPKCKALAKYLDGTDEHMTMTRREHYQRLNVTDRNAYLASIAPTVEWLTIAPLITWEQWQNL